MANNHLMSRRTQYFSPIVMRSGEAYSNHQQDLYHLDLELREQREANISRFTTYILPDALDAPRGIFLPGPLDDDDDDDSWLYRDESVSPGSETAFASHDKSSAMFSGTVESPTSVVADDASIRSIPFLPLGDDDDDDNKPSRRTVIKLRPKKSVLCGTMAHSFLPSE